MLNILALVTGWNGQTQEVEAQAENFLEFFASQKFGSFFTSRKETALELALPYLVNSNLNPTKILNLSNFEGFKFRSADNVTEIEVLVVE